MLFPCTHFDFVFLLGEDVDGQAFLDLKEEEVKGLFTKLGHVKKVLRLQSSVTDCMYIISLCVICIHYVCVVKLT